MSATVGNVKFKPGDYKSTLNPVWCPGCGDFGVLNALYGLHLPVLSVECLNALP